MMFHLSPPKKESSSKIKISNPERPCDPAVEISKFEYYCQRMCPYIIVTCLIILVILLLFAFLKYGRFWFSTPENHVEHLENVVLCYGGLYEL